MQIQFANREYCQEPGQVLSGALQQGGLLQVAQGEVWLTIEGELEDYFLHAGEACALPARRMIVIEAQDAHTCFSLQQLRSLPGAARNDSQHAQPHTARLAA